MTIIYMNYGVPYKGSKNKIAEWAVSNLPKATNFYDLFAGGCAVTHCALLSGKFSNYYANDIWTAPKLFLDAINGKYANETRWISREEFFEKRLSDPYIQFCWSFGNNGTDYMYSREIEPYKKACHYAIVFDDWKLLKKLCPEIIDVTQNALNEIKDIQKRRLNFGSAVVKELKRIGDWNLVQNNPLYKSCHWQGGKLDCNHNDLKILQSLVCLQSLQSLQRLQSLVCLQSLERLQSLQVSQDSYENIVIKPNSVIYCDIPYRNTSGYNFLSNKKSDKNSFDYDAFYSWCKKQKELVIVSEYSMPEDFICVNQIVKTTSLQGGNKNATEKLFVPCHQIELYNSLMHENKTSYKDSDFVQVNFDFMSE